jgi:hypothetical protein
MKQESAESSRTSRRARRAKGSHAGRKRRWTEAVRGWLGVEQTEAMKGEGRSIQSDIRTRHKAPQEEP